VRVVLADANVLYSRVLRDYLLYASAQGVLQIRWSRTILEEMTRHLIANNLRFDEASAERLITAMNSAFPAAEVPVDSSDFLGLEHLSLPDEDDLHVLAAAVATEADVLCTDNLKDFPAETMREVDIEIMSADALLSHLIREFPGSMLAAHQLAVANLVGASDESTLNALRRAGAKSAASLMHDALNRSTSTAEG